GRARARTRTPIAGLGWNGAPERSNKMVDPVARDEIRHATSLWWVLSLVGLLSIAAGVIILFKPGDSLETLSVIAGIFLVVDAIFELAASLFPGTQNRGLVAIVGVLSLLAGIVLIRHPIAGVAAAAILIALWLITVGARRLGTAVERPD